MERSKKKHMMCGILICIRFQQDWVPDARASQTEQVFTGSCKPSCAAISAKFSHRSTEEILGVSVWVRALLHLSIRFEVLLATPERCEVETPTFARVVIALELEASHASHSSERNVFWSALLMYVEDDHKTQHPLVNPTRLLKRLRVFCFKATISYCFAIEALSPEQGGILQYSWWHLADVCQLESEHNENSGC